MPKDCVQESWIPLWNIPRVTHEISEGAIFQHLDQTARLELPAISALHEKVAGALSNPKPLDICMPVLNAVLAAQYYEIFEALQAPRDMAVYEPCVGASNPVLVAAETYSAGRAAYFSINLNRKLREELRAKTGHLSMRVQIIEDNAEEALNRLAPCSVDVACFHHAVNDILQTAVSEARGMDTAAVDWFPNERQMIEWLDEDVRAGRLEHRGKPELMRIVGDAARLVRPGGYLIFDHFNWCRFIGVPWFPWDLFYNLIPMTRQWVAESGLPLRELHLDGVDPQWWMLLQVEEPEDTHGA